MRRPFDLILFTNFEGLDTSRAANVLRIALVYALAENMNGVGKMLVVTHYVSLTTTTWRRSRRFWNYLREPACRKLKDNLWVYTPLVPFNLALAEKVPGAMKVLRHVLRRSLNRALTSLEFDQSAARIAWLSHPYHLYHVGLAEEDVVIYHCADDFTLLGRASQDMHIAELEKALAQNSDLVLATAHMLQERLAPCNPRTHYFSNAVDFALFHQAAEPDSELAQEMRDIPGPIIGFMGNISDWYDYDLLQEVVGRASDWSFVFVGQVTRNVQNRVDQLGRYPNVYFLGWKDYYTLPTYLKGFDVAIMPYRVNEFMRSVNPNKLYQFMAAGLPIVSTPIPEAAKFSEVIDLADGPDEFYAAIERLIGQRGSTRIQKGLEIARRESWEARAEMAVKLIREHLEQKGK